MEEEKLSHIQKMLKRCVSPLLKAVLDANKEITKLEKAGYKVTISVWTHGGGYSEAFKTELENCVKDFAKSKRADRGLSHLKKCLRDVTKELTSLADDNYWVEITPARPNGNRKLFVEKIAVTLDDMDFGAPQLESQL